jgi:hypothetical protein
MHDADALFAAFEAAGALIVHEPIDRDDHGNREFAVRDLDGYIIAFAHDIARKAKREAAQADRSRRACQPAAFRNGPGTARTGAIPPRS